MKFDLNGSWQLHEVGADKWLSATVPGCNFTDLMANEMIPNPFIGMNEKEVQWVAEKDWEYLREFVVPTEILNMQSVMLECDMLDTIAEIYLNDELVAKTENSHIGYQFEVKQYLNKLKNKIRIKFLSPVKYVEAKQEIDSMPHNNMGITGVPHIRKPQCHMGWDWGPILPISGIVKDIRLQGYGIAKIDEMLINQTHSQEKVALSITAKVLGDCQDLVAKLEVTSPNGEVVTKEVPCAKNLSVDFDIENPMLWWPNDISEVETQPLYSVVLSLLDNANTIDKKSQRIGLRTIVLNREADKYGKNFQFIVNGVPIFAKGANWIPADSFINRFDKEKIDYFLQSVADSNMNMIRVWGGGYYESDMFYDKCDELGILIWQDFAFACAPYPFYNDAFKDNVLKEIDFNVKRLRNHASLALWCGNNEIEMMTIGWKLKTKLVEWSEKFFYHILPEFLTQLDGVTPYIVGSPCSSKGFLKSFNSDSDGDSHLWHVWHGLQPLTYYRKRFTRFCSEFGLESLPDMKTIKGFAEEKDYSLKSDVFMAHQKCTSGNAKMLYYMATRFRIPEKFEDTVYLTQVIQHECVKDATEHWRRNRGRCNGSLYWQLNDCWPVSSWSSIDYEGRFKVLQYGAKHFNAPIMVSIEDNKSKFAFFVINDYNQPFEGYIKYSFENFEGKEFVSTILPVKVDKVSSTLIGEFDASSFAKKAINKKDKVVICELYDNEDCLVSRKTALMLAEKDLVLANPELETTISVKGGVATVTVSAKKFARFVKLDLEGSFKPFSDNCFDMLAGEEVTVTVPVGKMKLEEVEAKLSVMSIFDIKAKGGKFNDFLFQTKVALTPINIANFFYYYLV